MTTKQLSITINIPAHYRYMARHPYGDICLFKEKPFIVKGEDGEEFWDVQEEELSVFGDNNADLMSLNQVQDWRNSLVDLGY